MVYKIKQEGFKNSGIEELSFWMTDYAGPRLTASNGKKRVDEWTSNKMKEMGLPAYQFIQDEIEYGRGYHTNMDTYERLIMDDLKYNAVIVASLVYNAAMRDQVLPGKPQIESLQRSQQRRAF